LLVLAGQGESENEDERGKKKDNNEFLKILNVNLLNLTHEKLHLNKF